MGYVDLSVTIALASRVTRRSARSYRSGHRGQTYWVGAPLSPKTVNDGISHAPRLLRERARMENAARVAACTSTQGAKAKGGREERAWPLATVTSLLPLSLAAHYTACPDPPPLPSFHATTSVVLRCKHAWCYRRAGWYLSLKCVTTNVLRSTDVTSLPLATT